MADSKLTALAALAGAGLASNDVFELTDISDTSMDASGTSKKIPATDLATGLALVGGLYVPQVVVKTADETISASTTLQADDHLIIPSVGATSTEMIWVEGLLFMIAANATMDFKLGWTGPTGAAFAWGWGDHANSGYAGMGVQATTGSPLALNPIGTNSSVGTSASNLMALHVFGWFTGGGTSGSLGMTWAQNTSDAGNLTVKKGSFLRYTRLIA